MVGIGALVSASIALGGCGAADDGTEAVGVDTTTSVVTTAAPTTAPPPPPPTTAPPPQTSAAKSAVPPCDQQLMLAAYDELAGVVDSDESFVTDQQPYCIGDVARLFVAQLEGTTEYPDFGEAVFVAKDGRWKALARFRGSTPANADDELVVDQTTPEQRDRIRVLFGGDTP